MRGSAEREARKGAAMRETPHYLGITEFVEGLCQHLEQTLSPSKPRYSDERKLRGDVLKVARGFLQEKLTPLKVSGKVWKEAEPISLLGTDFCPKAAIEVGHLPTVALDLELVREGENPALKISSAIGQAVIYSRRYPAVIAFIVVQGLKEDHKQWWDQEFKMELWARYKIKLVLM